MKIYTDGGSRGNPGKAACAFIVTENHRINLEKAKFIGTATNNEAEYNAIILALKWADENKKNNFELISDSELVIKQINGEYKINKLHLKKLNQQVQKLVKDKKIKFSNASRENFFIMHADELVNLELDRN